MIYDPLPVKFLPQKKLLVWAQNSLIFCSKLPRSQNWRYQEFLLHQKMAKEGSKNQKKNQKKYSKDSKKNFGTSGTIFGQNRFWGSEGGPFHGYFPYPGDRHTVTSLCYRYFYSESKITWFHLSNAALRSPIRWLEKYTTLNQKPSKNHTAVFYAWFWKKKLHENEKRVLQLFSRDLIHHFIKVWITSVLK